MVGGTVVDTETEPVSEPEGVLPDEQVVWERDKTLNIYQRIHAIMAEVGRVEKDGTVKIGSSGYDYISHDAVTATIRGSFLRHGVMVIPTVSGSVVNGNRTELTISVKFVNIDQPDDAIEIETLGFGVDQSDKGPGKAFSYAVKYAYLKLLMLNSADDIEANNVTHDPAQPTASQQVAAEHQDVQKQAEWAETFKAAITNAQSIEELNALRKKNKTMLDSVPDVTRDYFVDLIERRKGEFEDAAGAE